MESAISKKTHEDIVRLTKIRNNAEELASSADRKYWKDLERRHRTAVGASLPHSR